MKQVLIIILLVLSAIQPKAQVETCFYTKSETPRSDYKYTRKSTVIHTMPSFDLEKIKKEDAENERPYKSFSKTSILEGIPPRTYLYAKGADGKNLKCKLLIYITLN